MSDAFTEKRQLTGYLPDDFSAHLWLDDESLFSADVIISGGAEEFQEQRFLLEGLICSAPGVWADEVVEIETRYTIRLLSNKTSRLGQEMVIEDFADWVLERARFKFKKSGCDWKSLKLTRL